MHNKLFLALLALNSAHANNINSLISNSEQGTSSELKIEIHNIDKMKGNINIAVFNNKDTWLKKATFSTVLNINNEHCQQSSCHWLVKDVKFGSYGIAVFHDIDKNGKMKYNFLGMPQENYGFSNNETSFFGLPPSWNKANFSVKKQEITHKINLL
mgnify:CR=1 FL=1